tara:strand:+ start:2552 stop:2758 length:207 start_codon:yes stop_codon:yes gene_type:complete
LGYSLLIDTDLLSFKPILAVESGRDDEQGVAVIATLPFRFYGSGVVAVTDADLPADDTIVLARFGCKE